MHAHVQGGHYRLGAGLLDVSHAISRSIQPTTTSLIWITGAISV